MNINQFWNFYSNNNKIEIKIVSNIVKKRGIKSVVKLHAFSFDEFLEFLKSDGEFQVKTERFVFLNNRFIRA